MKGRPVSPNDAKFGDKFQDKDGNRGYIVRVTKRNDRKSLRYIKVQYDSSKKVRTIKANDIFRVVKR